MWFRYKSELEISLVVSSRRVFKVSRMQKVTSVDLQRENEIVDKNSIEDFFKREIMLLRLAGLFSMKNVFTNKNVKSTIWEPIVLIIGLLILFLMVIDQLAYVKLIWHIDPGKAMITLSASASGILSLMRCLELWFSRKKIVQLMRSLSVMWKSVNISMDTLRAADTAYKAGKFYITMLLLTAISFSLRPYFFLLRHYSFERFQNVSYDYTMTMFPSKYVWSIDSMEKYLLNLCWQQLVIYFVVIYSISLDVLFVQLTSHATIQFQILAYDLKNSSSELPEEKNRKRYIEYWSRIVTRHHELYKYCELIQELYERVIFIQLLLTSMNICLTIVHIDKQISLGQWMELSKNICHATSLVAQVALYCNFAEKLTEESKLVGQAAYESQWTSRCKESKIILQFIIMRSQKRFEFTAFLFSLNFQQLTSIFNAAGSYYALLKTLS